MSNKREDFKRRIDALVNLPFKEIEAFLKRKHFRNSKYPELFWNSPLPTKWTKELLQVPFVLNLLFNYFSKAENVNSNFLNKITLLNPKILIKAIKLSRAFEIEEHWNSFKLFKTNQDYDLKIFYKELDYLRRLIKEWEERSNFFEGVIQELDYEDILIHVISYFEKFKRSEKNISDQNLLTSYEINFCYVLNNLLNIKQNTVESSKVIPKKKFSILDFRKAIEENLPPLNTVEGLVKGKYLAFESVTQEKKLIRETISFYFSFFINNYQIDKYLCGYADFEWIEGLEANLVTNDSFRIHQRNDKKNWFQENLIRNKTLQNQVVKTFLSKEVTLYEKQTILSTHAAVTYWEYLKLPQLIDLGNGNQINTKQLFHLLYTFSNYLMPYGRKIVYTEGDPEQYKIVFMQSKPERFSSLFESNYMYVIEKDRLLQNCASYFGWGEAVIRTLIDFLTTDLNSDDFSPIDFMSRPLIKIDTQYIWLSSLLKARRWEVLMHKRWITENSGSKLIQLQSSEIEKNLAENFKKAGFKACFSYKFKNGEIDTIAYKDKILFVLELKTTYVDESLLRYGWYKNIQLGYKASDQLKKIEEYIQANYEEVKNIPELGIDCDQDELKIMPLIVSNIFEIDDYIIKGKYNKISLFELGVILNNDLYDTLNSKLYGEYADTSFSTIIQSYNRNSAIINNNSLKSYSLDECELWSTSDSCSPLDLIDAIDKKRIWIGLDELIEFHHREQIAINGSEKIRDPF